MLFACPLRPEYWPGIPFVGLCNTRPTYLETTAASDNGSKDDIQHCNHMVLCLALVGDRWAEGRMAAGALTGIPSVLFGSNISSSHLTNPSPIGLAIHCSPHCNQRGMAKLL